MTVARAGSAVKGAWAGGAVKGAWAEGAAGGNAGGVARVDAGGVTRMPMPWAQGGGAPARKAPGVRKSRLI